MELKKVLINDLQETEKNIGMSVNSEEELIEMALYSLFEEVVYFKKELGMADLTERLTNLFKTSVVLNEHYKTEKGVGTNV